MKRFLVASLLVSLSAVAAETITHTLAPDTAFRYELPIEALATFVVTNPNGALEITGTEGDRLVVSGLLSAEKPGKLHFVVVDKDKIKVIAEPPEEDTAARITALSGGAIRMGPGARIGSINVGNVAGGDIIIVNGVRVGGPSVTVRSPTIKLKVEVPAQLLRHLKAIADGGSIQIHDLPGAPTIEDRVIVVNCENGGIGASRVVAAGGFYASSTHGNLDVRRIVAPRIRLRTHSGTIDAARNSGFIDAVSQTGTHYIDDNGGDYRGRVDYGMIAVTNQEGFVDAVGNVGAIELNNPKTTGENARVNVGAVNGRTMRDCKRTLAEADEAPSLFNF